MPEETPNINLAARSRDEVALEMMKFIAVTTGYGKGSSAAGFTGKTVKTPIIEWDGPELAVELDRG